MEKNIEEGSFIVQAMESAAKARNNKETKKRIAHTGKKINID
jgi:hypothetical protein